MLDTAAEKEPRGFIAHSLSVSLTVRDLRESVDWYRDVLGFAVDRPYEREGRLVGVSMAAGEVRILLNQDDGAKGWDRPKGEGFSLHFTTPQDVDDLARRIREAGGTLALEPTDMPWGARVFRVEDPDGFRIAISSIPEAGERV
jgi:uncharacterized glyoxalase superfamily protein PhnB